MKSKLFSLLTIFFLIGISCYAQSEDSLKAGDGVKITFYNISENISGSYYVQQDGYIQLPFLRNIFAENKPFNEVKNKIKAAYDSLYRDPELFIQPLFRVNILGEVNKPGLYYVTGVEKFSELLGMAGGATADAAIDDIYFIRNNQEEELDAEKILLKGDTINDVGLKSGDRIYVPRKWYVDAKNATFIISGLAVIVTLIGIFVK